MSMASRRSRPASGQTASRRSSSAPRCTARSRPTPASRRCAAVFRGTFTAHIISTRQRADIQRRTMRASRSPLCTRMRRLRSQHPRRCPAMRWTGPRGSTWQRPLCADGMGRVRDRSAKGCADARRRRLGELHADCADRSPRRRCAVGDAARPRAASSLLTPGNRADRTGRVAVARTRACSETPVDAELARAPSFWRASPAANVPPVQTKAVPGPWPTAAAPAGARWH